MRYTIAPKDGREPTRNPYYAAENVAHGFHPSLSPTWIIQVPIAKAFDNAADYREALDYVQQLFGIDTHLTRAGW